MNKPEPKEINITSPDINAERLDTLKQLFPDLFDGEGELDEKTLRDLVSKDGLKTTERFRFEWAGKMQSKRNAFKPSKATLVFDKERSVAPETTKNLIIEADNLEALKLLQTTYFERVKCIYIDPPYNTEKDFIYPDNYSETQASYWQKNGTVQDGVKLTAITESSGRKHSNWLNMMQARLYTAKNLLLPDGVIMLHIDEHERHRLQLLLEEVFGADNFLGEIIWDKRNPKGRVGGVAEQHEHILVFCKSFEDFKKENILKVEKTNAKKMLSKADYYYSFVGQTITPPSVLNALKTLNMKDDESFRKQYSLEDANSDFQNWLNEQSTSLSGGEAMYKYIDTDGKVYRLVSMAAPDKPETRSHEALIHPITKKACPVPAKGWRNPPDRMKDLLKNNRIVFGEDESTQPQRKYILEENMEENLSSLIYYGGSDEPLLKSLKIPFDNPKPVEIVKRLLESIVSDNDIVIDFFAGSGTTGHASLLHNLKFKQNIKFILVQVPEVTDEKHPAFKAGFKTISDLCIERVKRAGEKIRAENPKAEIDTGFKVYKLAESHFPQNNFAPDPDKSDAENAKAFEEHLKSYKQADLFKGEVFDDVVTEIALKNGFGLFYSLEQQKEFKNNAVYLLAGNEKDALLCLDEDIKDDTIDLLKDNHTEQQLIVSRHALDTTKKWTLQEAFKDNLNVV